MIKKKPGTEEWCIHFSDGRKECGFASRSAAIEREKEIQMFVNKAKNDKDKKKKKPMGAYKARDILVKQAPTDSTGKTSYEHVMAVNAMGRLYFKTECGYVSISDEPEAACGACRFFDPSYEGFGYGGWCQIVEGQIGFFGSCDFQIKTVDEIKAIHDAGAFDMIAKEAEKATLADMDEFEFQVDIKKADTEKQLTYGVVVRPGVEDLHGDIHSFEEVEAMAHNYLVKSRIVFDQHNEEADADVVESSISLVDIPEYDIKKGDWVQVTHINDPDLWQQVKKGEKTCYSYGGYGYRTPV